MATHILKTIGVAWDAVASGEKRFEVRKNDRFFQRGDTVVLRRLSDITSGYDTGIGMFDYRDLRFSIGWMLQGGQFGVEAGHVVFSLDPEPAVPNPQGEPK